MFVDTPIDWDQVPIFDEYGNIIRPVPSKQDDDRGDPDALMDASDASLQPPPVTPSSPSRSEGSAPGVNSSPGSDSSGSTGSVHSYWSSRMRSSACTTPTPSDHSNEKQEDEDKVRTDNRDMKTSEPENGEPSEPENGEDGLRLFGASIFVRGERIERLPHPIDIFDDIIKTDHMPFLYKPGGMDQLYRLFSAHRPILLRRPAGWGIEIFAATFAARIDLRYSYHFDGLRAYTCTSESMQNLHQDCLLALDFRHVEFESESDIPRALADYVHAQCTDFCRRYGFGTVLPMDSFTMDENPASEIVLFLVGDAQSIHRMVILIENFDALPESDYLQTFFAEVESVVACGWLNGFVLLSDKADPRMEECVKRFDRKTHPFPEKRKTSSFGFTSLLDVSHHPAFQTAVGCTQWEVREFDEALALSFPNAQGNIFAFLHQLQPHPVLFADPESERELPSAHPSRRVRLHVDGGNEGVYALNDVYQALTEKYEQYGLERNVTPME
ncbi:hypothetical protein MKEN_00760100 [Mycena kentingensis (nom. inval.)]|nr:hypothetical protein MKEN_00760100 [Mycena kentingensis (nom. inval.)]